jgi:hypothetical protein
MSYIKRLSIQILFFAVIIACLSALSACSRDPQGLRKPAYNRDVVADIINQSEYQSQHTTIEVVERDMALYLLNGSY